MVAASGAGDCICVRRRRLRALRWRWRRCLRRRNGWWQTVKSDRRPKRYCAQGRNGTSKQARVGYLRGIGVIIGYRAYSLFASSEARAGPLTLGWPVGWHRRLQVLSPTHMKCLCSPRHRRRPGSKMHLQVASTAALGHRFTRTECVTVRLQE